MLYSSPGNAIDATSITLSAIINVKKTKYISYLLRKIDLISWFVLVFLKVRNIMISIKTHKVYPTDKNTRITSLSNGAYVLLYNSKFFLTKTTLAPELRIAMLKAMMIIKVKRIYHLFRPPLGWNGFFMV